MTARPIASGGAAEFTDVPNGTHRVRLSSLAAYCFPMESNPEAVEVRGEEATLRFTVSCPGPSAGRTLLYAAPTGTETHLFVMTPGDTDRVDLTPDAPVRHGCRRLGSDAGRRGGGQDRGIPGLGPPTAGPSPSPRHPRAASSSTSPCCRSTAGGGRHHSRPVPRPGAYLLEIAARLGVPEEPGSCR